MNTICVIGTGYVGLVTGACFADLGNDVKCVDTQLEKISALQAGVIPFHEPGLADLVARNIKKGRLAFTTSLADGMADAEFVFIAVGTPSQHDGEADLQYVRAAAAGIADNLHHDTIIINKSTVPVETGDIVDAIIRDRCPSEVKTIVASNPEFLREGSAIADFMKPDRVVIGVHDDGAAKRLAALYAPLNADIIFTNIRTAEMVKYTANAFLAAKISFTNEIAKICQAVGADIKEVVRGAGSDHRIGTAFMEAGLGFGGSCLPKDVHALVHIARKHGVAPEILEATLRVNNQQIVLTSERLDSALGGLRGRKIALLGLSFKSGTDDVRESRSIALAQHLLGRGATIVVHDPVATPNARADLADVVIYASTVENALVGADAIVLATVWEEYVGMDLVRARALMRGDVFFDARNAYDYAKVEAAGFRYFGIGTGAVERIERALSV